MYTAKLSIWAWLGGEDTVLTGRWQSHLIVGFMPQISTKSPKNLRFIICYQQFKMTTFLDAC